MGRAQPAAQGGYVYHVLNRANARMRIFDDEGDYRAFEKVLAKTVERTQIRTSERFLAPAHTATCSHGLHDPHVHLDHLGFGGSPRNRAIPRLHGSTSAGIVLAPPTKWLSSRDPCYR
jgi:hypothetical protein